MNVRDFQYLVVSECACKRQSWMKFQFLLDDLQQHVIARSVV